VYSELYTTFLVKCALLTIP